VLANPLLGIEMETVLIVCIVGFIAYIAGRGQVGTNFVTTEHAQSVAGEMYERGRTIGQTEALQAVRLQTEETKAAINTVALLDEYINGYTFAMKAVREHGHQAEAAMKDHMAEVLVAREQAIIANPTHRAVVHI
jgi:hypothetical protein